MSRCSRFLVALGVFVCVAGTQAQASPGDMNGDTVVDGLDVDAFVMAMLDPPGYALAYPLGDWNDADLDCDAGVDTDDIPLFVDCVLNGNCDCPDVGACCDAVGGCTQTAEAGCTGDWQGAGTVCTPNPCPQPVVVETVSVGNLGNPNDTGSNGLGGVAYTYNIGMYEVTAGQYAEFLNAVAAADTYGLYNERMDIDSGLSNSQYACNIKRSGSSPNYTYRVAADWADRPVNFVSWGDAARFVNWLHNGQPVGAQDASTTEDGSYFLDGATSDAELMTITWEQDGTWAIPTEHEWYKAAYHKNDGVTGNYWDYPTSSDSAPGYVNDSGSLSGTGTPFTEGGTDPGNYATIDGDGGTNGTGSPYYRTEVAEWENSSSPYDTFDQGGNVVEWNEGIMDSFRGVLGGSFVYDEYFVRAAYRSYYYPTIEGYLIGFRVTEIP